MGIPQTSCDYYQAALTFNKRDLLSVLKPYGIKTATSFYLNLGDNINLEEIISKVGLPCFVKPNKSGSSFGISKVKSLEELLPAIENAYKEASKIFNKYRISLSGRHRRLYKPSIQTQNTINLEAFFITVNRFAFGTETRFSSKRENYFEPRVDGRFVTYPANLELSGWISTDFRKKFAIDLNASFNSFVDDPQHNYSAGFQPRYRFSEHFFMIWESNIYLSNDNKGYVDDNEVDVYFGQRDIINLETSLQASYNFDPYKAIDLRFRNFWGTANYKDNLFYILNENGSLTYTSYDISENNPNTNFNIWNIDLSFRWRFAPGSEATLLYRNQIFNEDDLSNINFGDSLDNLFQQTAQHTFSIRVTYFLDYNNLKNVFKHNS